MRLLLIGCAVLTRELSDAITHSPHLVDAIYLPEGLHDSGAKSMRRRIQQAIDEAVGYDFLLLGYGLCGNGIAGVQSRSIPLVVPKAHDCIGLLLGNTERYREYLEQHPGTYFRSSGWVERAASLAGQAGIAGVYTSLADFIEKYGEDAGKYLYEEFHRYEISYQNLTFIRTGLEPDKSFSDSAQAEARQKHWTYEEVKGTTALFRRLLAGDWDKNFLVVSPGHCITPTIEGQVIKAVLAEDGAK